MSKYKFIKSRDQMIKELEDLWDNYELYRFIKGEEYIYYRELEICECMVERDIEEFINISKMLYNIKKRP